MKLILLVLALTATAFAQRAAAPVVATPVSPAPGGVNIGEAEAQKVEDRIATVRRDALSKYETSLGDLQLQFQKAADLEAAIAARAERERVHTEQVLSEKNFVSEPKSLRTLQQTSLTKMQDLVSGVVGEALPRLIEYKKQLTVDGRLDEALAVKQIIERLQNANVPITRAEPGSFVQAETILRAYSADRSRADKTYKGVKIAVRGMMGGYRLDPDTGKNLHVFLTGGTSTGWVQCSFNLTSWRYREERLGTNTTLILQPKDGAEVKMAKGQQVEVLGECTGWDELVKLAKCEVPR